MENVRSTNCIDCLKISIKRVFEIQFKKLDAWGQGTNAIAITMIAGAVINSISNKEPGYEFYEIVKLGAPGAIIIMGNSLTQLARRNRRTIAQKELLSSSFEDSKGFYLTGMREAYFHQVKSTLLLYNETIQNDPAKEDVSVLITDKSGNEIIGSIVKFEMNILHFTRSKNEMIDLRKSRSDTPDTIRFEDIASLQRAKKELAKSE